MTPSVTVRALASLAAFAPPEGRLAIGPGETVAAVAGRLGLDFEKLGTVLVNGQPAVAGTVLEAGDSVSFIPPITGG